MHSHLIGNRHRDDIREIVLALSIFIFQCRQPLIESVGRQHHNAGVDLIDLSLFGISIFFFNNGADSSIGITDDAPISCRVVQFDR